MSSTTKTVILVIIIILIIVGIGAVFAFKPHSTATPAQPVSTAPAATGTTTASTGTSASSTPSYTLADIAEHGTASDCWTAVSGKVYNITSFIPQHPGGPVIIQACGKDGTSLFDEMSSGTQTRADSVLQQYFIGNLAS